MSETYAKKMSMAGVLTTQDVKVRRNLRDMSFIYFSILVFVAAVGLIALSFLWSRLKVYDLGYEISKANAERSALLEQNKRLRVDFISLNSPDRIEALASKELGLAHPAGEQIINVK